MSKEPDTTNVQKSDDDMAPEYAFDYAKARSNRFAPHLADGSLVVVLDPDIAEVFITPESVKKCSGRSSKPCPSHGKPLTVLNHDEN